MLDLAIIGGGPAGLSAGLYATRGGLKNVALFEMGMPGGQITGSSEIENYPGVKEIMSGIDFMRPWQEQCFRFGLKHEMSEIVRITKKNDIFQIIQSDDRVIESRSVIVATGGKPKKSGIKGESEFWGRGVSVCATCDGFFYKNKEVVVLGGGDTALEEAIYLSRICSKVYLVHRRESFRAAPSTIQKVQASKQIEILAPAIVKEIGGDHLGVSFVDIEMEGKLQRLNVPGIFIFVGYEVNHSILKQEDGSFLCECDSLGSVIVDLSMKTNVKGLFAAGDLRVHAPKQVVCAAGDGATAALSVLAYLEEHK